MNERWYACDNCGRVGPMSEFQDECKPGWTHGTLLPLDMGSPALSSLRGSVAALEVVERAVHAHRESVTGMGIRGGPMDHALWGLFPAGVCLVKATKEAR